MQEKNKNKSPDSTSKDFIDILKIKIEDLKKEKSKLIQDIT